jgi:GNAT superfamily N-acetyltransferase
MRVYSSRERSKCVVRRADSHAPETLRLVERLWHELGALYPEVKGPPFVPDEIAGERASFVVAWVKGEPVGCGAFRPLSEQEGDVAEIKRMYVAPGMRGRGISRSILVKLEKLARDCGYAVVRLETGLRQPNAIRLYETSDYHRIERYGRHRDDPLSVCFEKNL